MSAYWDSSALVEATLEEEVRWTLVREGGLTRAHSFSEVFSTLTGGRLGFRSRPEDAAKICRELASELDVVDLGTEGVLLAIGKARRHGVRGGQIHDFLHAQAALKSGCDILLTLNLEDFRSLRLPLKVAAPPRGQAGE
ncbi:MAG: PIN domain-containing protein [Terrimicrobiaceae bacterium]